MNRFLSISFFLFLTLKAYGSLAGVQQFEVRVLHEQELWNLHLIAQDSRNNVLKSFSGYHQFTFDQRDTISIRFTNGSGSIQLEDLPVTLLVEYTGEDDLRWSKLIHFHEDTDTLRAFPLPMWVSILPPLVAIAFALIFKEVIVSLFAGIWLGAFILYGFNFRYLLHSIFNVLDKYILRVFSDSSHVSIIIFSILIGGMVAVISRNGGMQGIVNKLSGYTKNSKRAQLSTWFLGLAIFFDDYANTLIAGNTMRPVTDSFRISREKLAYIVDSTAAPIAAIAFITTWIGFQLGQIDTQTGILEIDTGAYSLFLSSLKYAYYPVLTIFFVLIIILLQRDFGSMFHAEIRARVSEKKKSEETAEITTQKPAPLWYNAFIPVLTMIVVTIAGLIYTGMQTTQWQPEFGIFQNLSAIIGEADPYLSLLWASFSALSIAIILSTGTGSLSFRQSIEGMIEGFKTMVPAILILVLAWALASVTIELKTAEFLTSVVRGTIHPYFVPMIVFILAGLIAFSTGSSWSTMAILYPIAIPASWAIGLDAGLSPTETLPILYNVISVVLAGAVFGDHCSPISDTTILSSLASGCNHIDHVRTQLPYALVVGAISIVLGGIFFYLGIPWYINYLIGMAGIFVVIRYIGKPVPLISFTGNPHGTHHKTTS